MYLESFMANERHVMLAMLDLADLQQGDKHVDLGSGDGQFVAEVAKRGFRSVGYEWDRRLVIKSRRMALKIKQGDFFEADLSQYNVVTFWFTVNLLDILDKLHADLKPGSRVVCRYGDIRRWKHGIEVERANVPDHVWQPQISIGLDDALIYRYVR